MSDLILCVARNQTSTRWRREVHRDCKRVAVRDSVIDDALDVDGLQLEVHSDVDQPGCNNTTQSDTT